LNGIYRVKDWKMARMASRATMVACAAMVIRVSFECARRLNAGKAYRDQQNQHAPEYYGPA
jgi:hypothetical protein